jgi:hypothetical protein
MDEHPEVLVAFQNRYKKNSVAELEQANPKVCVSQAIAKWLVDRAHSHKFIVRKIKPYYYARYPAGIGPYEIYKQVLVLTPGTINVARIPTKDLPTQDWMIHGLKNCVQQHDCVDVENKLLSLPSDKLDEIYREIDHLSDMAG